MKQPIWNFEQEPHEPEDETGTNLRAYFDRMPDVQMLAYSADWTDAVVMEWDGNFTDEGTLFLICSERDIDVTEYRRVLHQALAYRNRMRAK